MVSTENRHASELASRFEISFPAVSKHLKVLENANLIKRDVDGRIHRFTLKPKTMKRAYDWLEKYTQFWDANLDQLDAYLKRKRR